MWLLFIIIVANGLVAWLVFTAWTQRWARRHVATVERSLEQLLDHAGAALHAGSLQDVFERAASCARDVWGSTGVMLVYLSDNRVGCRMLRWGQSEVELPAAHWKALLTAPWNLGILTRAQLSQPAGTATPHPLDALAEEFHVDVFVPWIERDRLVCVTAMLLGRPLDRYDHALLDLWNMGIVQACANYIMETRTVTRDLVDQVAQASAIVQALPSQAMRGSTGDLSWTVHERQRASDQPGGGFWEVLRLSDDRLLVIAGETIAAGLAASMLSIAIRGCCDTLHAVLGDAITPGRVLSHINTFIWRRTNPIGMSCIAVLFDQRTGRMHHAVAGPITLWRLHWREGAAVLEPRPHRGPLLGDRLDADFQSREWSMASGDVFLLLPEQTSLAVWPGDRPDEVRRDPRLNDARHAQLEDIERRVLTAAAGAASNDGVPMVLVRHGR